MSFIIQMSDTYFEECLIYLHADSADLRKNIKFSL
jgi:hypothetical protein